MGGLISIFSKKEPETHPIESWFPRVKNIVTYNWRGIISPWLPLILYLKLHSQTEFKNTVIIIWITMFWFLLIQPVNVPVVGMVPIAFFPTLCALSTAATCSSYFNNTVALYIIAGWVGFLMNNANFDRRVILKILGGGKMTNNGIIIRASLAGYIMSIFSNRLIVTAQLMEFVSTPIMNAKIKAEKVKGPKVDYDSLRYVVCNAVQTSATIGGLAFIHGSQCIITFLSSYTVTAPDYRDIFNYASYSAFAIPVGLALFIANLIYSILLCKISVKGHLTEEESTAISNEIAKIEEENVNPSLSLHEKYSVFFTAAFLLINIFRYSSIFGNSGWASFSIVNGTKPRVGDTVASAIFAILLHILPNSFGFLMYFKSLKESELHANPKPESGVLFWKYVDKNTNYAYIMLIGSGIALVNAMKFTQLSEDIPGTFDFLTKMSWPGGLLIIILFSSALANTMTGVAAAIMIMPVLIFLGGEGDWVKYTAINCMACGFGCNFGFASPFLYTPAYFCKITAKVPYMGQFVCGVGSAIVCCLVSWVFLLTYAPVLFSVEVEPAPAP